MFTRLLLSNNMAINGFNKTVIPRISKIINKNYNTQKIFFKTQREFPKYDKFKIFAIKYNTRDRFLMREI